MFADREDAAIALVEKLTNYKDSEDTVIITIPRGGVPLGAVMAKMLNLPLDIVLSKKIGHPLHKEFAIGAVTLEDVILTDKAVQASDAYIDSETERIRELLQQRYDMYYDNNEPLNLKDKTVIIVDDGVATGNTLISSIELIKMQQPAKIIVALPVAPPSTFKKIEALPMVDDIICILVPDDFYAVGQFYKDFSQVSDVEVVRLLKEI